MTQNPKKTPIKDPSSTRILGIDPGTACTGYGVIDYTRSCSRTLDFGTIRSDAKEPLPKRYLKIHRGVEALIERFSPDVVVVETQFVQKNVQSALKVGMARGVVIVTAAKHDIAIEEVAPTRVKQAIVGTGSASKEQVQMMVQRLLNLPSPPSPLDASDALAIAITYANSFRETKCLNI